MARSTYHVERSLVPLLVANEEDLPVAAKCWLGTYHLTDVGGQGRGNIVIPLYRCIVPIVEGKWTILFALGFLLSAIGRMSRDIGDRCCRLLGTWRCWRDMGEIRGYGRKAKHFCVLVCIYSVAVPGMSPPLIR